MHIGKFFIAIWSDWLARMSGPLTVPFTIAAFFVSSATYKALFGVLAILAGLVTCYRVWVKEYERAEAEISKNQLPEFAGEINEAFICPVAYQNEQGQEARVHDSFVLIQVTAWNKRQMSPSSVGKYMLALQVNGKSYQGQFRWLSPSQGPPSALLIGHAPHSPQYRIEMGLGLADLRYLSHSNGDLLFLVEGLSATSNLTADIQLTLIDLIGKPHCIGKTNQPLITGRLKPWVA